jgi:hypothetical protein
MSTTRYTIDLDPTYDEKLSSLAKEKGVTKADVIRRALATYTYISGQAPLGGPNKISVTNQEDKVLKDLILP